MQRLAKNRRRLTAMAAAASLLAAYLVLLAVALSPIGPADRLPAGWLFLAVTIFSYLAEEWVARAAPAVVKTLAWVQVGPSLRFVFREVALVVLLVRVVPVREGQAAVFAGGLLGLHALRGVYSGLVIYINQHRRMPVVTRNIDLRELRIPDAPPPLLTAEHAKKMLHLDVLPVAGGLGAVLTTNMVWALAGVGAALAAGTAGCVIMAVHARRNAHLGDRARILATVNARVREHRPQVVLYFSGTRNAGYQVNMWLATLARLGRPTVILMRERWMVPLLGRTSLPVVCIEDMIDLVNFTLPSARVALFPANTGKNLHLLRVPGIGHVFVGHGDSDKAASVNPFAKAYDQVWVAGEGGRDRYLRAQVGVRDSDIIEVGRPQLAEIRTGPDGPADPMFTVLYAPTWEGWISDERHSSLDLLGPRIIRALIDHAPHIRVLYKPHPLSGTRDRKAMAAHLAIVALLEEASRQRAAAGTWADERSASSAAAVAEMARIQARLSELSGAGQVIGSPATRGGTTDYAMLSRDTRPDPARDAEWQRLTDAWHEAYWSSQGWWQHRVVTGPRPALYECFNRADLLISDISSVVADFVATGKPYVVTNLLGLGEAQFRDLYPTAAAGYLLGGDCAGLGEILRQAAAAGDDELARSRRELKHYLLGPDSPDAQTRFNDAVESLIKSVEQSAGTPGQSARTPGQSAGTPGQSAGTPGQSAGTPGLAAGRQA